MIDFARLHLCFLAGTLGQGGAERQLFQLLCALQMRGARLTVLSLRRDEFWQARIERLGVPVIWVGQSQARGRRLWEIIRHAQTLAPDVLQSQHFYANFYAALAGRAVGVPSIGALRSDVFSELATTPWVGRLCLKLPTALAVNSRAGLANAAGLGVARDRLHLLPNVIDTADFAPAVERKARDTIKLLAVGRLSREKRFDRFLRLVAALRQTGALVTGLLVGDGPLRDQLQQQADALGLAADVLELRGATTTMAEVYHESDILLSTSEFEGTPNVILEAMACGLPVVATAVGGVPEIITDNETGLLIAPDNAPETALIASVRRLLAAPQLRHALGAAARRHIAAHYAPANLSNHLSTLYRAVLL